MASMRLWSWQLHSPCVDRSGDFEAQQSINGRCSRQDRITRESIDGARVKSTCHQASAARRYCGRTRSALLLRYVAATACVLCMWTALCGAQYTSFLQYQGGFDLLDKWDDGFDLLEPRNNREPPADQGGLCAKGFESCLSLHSSAIESHTKSWVRDQCLHRTGTAPFRFTTKSSWLLLARRAAPSTALTHSSSQTRSTKTS